jgi:hypothetical protein
VVTEAALPPAAKVDLETPAIRIRPRRVIRFQRSVIIAIAASDQGWSA